VQAALLAGGLQNNRTVTSRLRDCDPTRHGISGEVGAFFANNCTQNFCLNLFITAYLTVGRVGSWEVKAHYIPLFMASSVVALE